MKSTKSRRASIVKESISTWTELLRYDFKDRYFVDDRSKNYSGIKILEQSSVAGKFDQIHVFPFSHAQHSNFGIVYSIEIANSSYVLHLDDDVMIKGTRSELIEYINKCVKLLDADKNILGINVLTLQLDLEAQKPWHPEKEYGDNSGFSHPYQFFGTCACILRRELLQRMSLDDVIANGPKQPKHWERIVSQDKHQFLVANAETPFVAHPKAWTITATHKTKAEQLVRKALRFVRGWWVQAK